MTTTNYPTDRDGQIEMFQREVGPIPELVPGPEGLKVGRDSNTGKRIIGPFMCPVCEGCGWFSLMSKVKCAICEGAGRVSVPADSIETIPGGAS